jgi:CubicO group peptidase (beta-lactamase class C family)
MFRPLLFAGIAAGLVLLTPVGVTHDLSAQATRQTPIDAVLRQAVERGDVPGVVAVATNRSSITYSGAFGKAEGSAERPMTIDTIFRIYSMTKAITSVAAMQLVEQQKIRLDDPVSKYLKPFDTVSVLSSFDGASGAYTLKPVGKPVTVRQLLTHTSGLGYPFTSVNVRDFKPKNGDTFEVGPLMFEPGRQWLYGTSTDWVGLLVEAVCGQTLDAYFKDHITGPLGMIDTFFNVPSAEQSRLVNQWRRDPAGALVEEPRQAPNVCRAVQWWRRTLVDRARLHQVRADDPERWAGPRRQPRVRRAGSLALYRRRDESEPDRRRERPGVEERHTSHERRLQLHQRRPGQVGTRVPDQHGAPARSSLARLAQLGRDQQHLLLDRPNEGDRRRHHDAVSAVCRFEGTFDLRSVRARHLRCELRGVTAITRPSRKSSGSRGR